eukprot:scaffold7307_cov13-Prasinocladus_malaysianus.AAC.1
MADRFAKSEYNRVVRIPLSPLPPLGFLRIRIDSALNATEQIPLRHDIAPASRGNDHEQSR